MKYERILISVPGRARVRNPIQTMIPPTQSNPCTKTFPRRWHHHLILAIHWLACLWLALAGTGCKSASGPGSASFASVTIHNQSPAQIQSATAQVFREDGYAGGASGPAHMVFQKEASRLTTISRDGLVAAQEGARTVERVRAELVDLGGGSYRLQCEAFMVTGAGDSFFEDEVRKTNLRSRPYQSLLNKVAKQLK